MMNKIYPLWVDSKLLWAKIWYGQVFICIYENDPLPCPCIVILKEPWFPTRHIYMILHSMYKAANLEGTVACWHLNILMWYSKVPGENVQGMRCLCFRPGEGSQHTAQLLLSGVKPLGTKQFQGFTQQVITLHNPEAQHLWSASKVANWQWLV